MDQFNKVANIYAKFRPTYPKEVYSVIQGLNNNKRYSKVADIGCGAGHSIEGLKTISNDIIGVEPGIDLMKEASEKYPEFNFVNKGGEYTGLPDECVDLVTVATAFYWMDREKAIKEFNRILKTNGQLALYRYLFPIVMSNKKVNDFIKKHCLNFWDQYRDERLTRVDDSDQLLINSGYFNDLHTTKVDNIWKLSTDKFVNFLTSTSYVSKHIEALGNGADAYVNELKSEIKSIAGDDDLDVNFDIHMILAKKK